MDTGDLREEVTEFADDYGLCTDCHGFADDLSDNLGDNGYDAMRESGLVVYNANYVDRVSRNRGLSSSDDFPPLVSWGDHSWVRVSEGEREYVVDVLWCNDSLSPLELIRDGGNGILVDDCLAIAYDTDNIVYQEAISLDGASAVEELTANVQSVMSQEERTELERSENPNEALEVAAEVIGPTAYFRRDSST